MRVWATTLLVLLGAIPFYGDDSARREVSLSEGARALVDESGVRLLVTAHRGDAWSRLSRRVTGDGSNWRALAAHNQKGESLWAGEEVEVPWELVKGELRAEALRLLFPEGGRGSDGWIHQIALDRNGEGESLWEVARWYTGAGTNYAAVLKASSPRPLSTRVGERVLIPSHLLLPELRDTRIDPLVSPPRSREVFVAIDAQTTADEAVPALHYDLEAETPFASYALLEGEAIYSSVAIRFTGRVHADDVNEAVNRIVHFNRIEDVSRLPVGYRVRIPLDMLTDQYLPLSDERRQTWEASRAISGGAEVRALRLEGVHVIIDPGHGGRDAGASFGEIWESNYVYDIARRLAEQLERQSAATVWMTTDSPQQDRNRDSDLIRAVTDHVLRTDPVYDLSSPTIGVNLRWYLSNAILSRLEAQGVPRDRIIFISIHADSLHPSLRGAMAYIPGRKYVTGSYGKKERVYLARREVRENPVSVVTDSDAVVAEARSHDLAKAILGVMREKGLAVHPYTSIRDHVVRQGREWVPAVIRHNQVPSRVLLEVGNLGNPDDRALLETRVWRERVAQAIFSGIASHFAPSLGSEATGPAIASR